MMQYELGILIPVYRATPALPKLLRALHSVLKEKRYHIYLIDDSADAQTHRYLNTHCLFCTTTLIQLSYNAGQQNALLCGIRAAVSCCDILVTMDDDGQHPPALLPELLALVRKEKSLVCAVPEIKKRTWRTLGSHVRDLFFNRVLRVLKGQRVSSYRAFSHDVAAFLANWQGDFFYLSAVALQTGCTVQNLFYTAQSRIYGESGYNWKKLCALYLRLVYHYAFSHRHENPTPPYEIKAATAGIFSFETPDNA